MKTRFFGDVCGRQPSGSRRANRKPRDLQRGDGTLDVIDERDASILRLRFGLQGEQPLTLKEIGARIGLTRERVRQLESEALGRIRAPSNRTSRPLV